MFRDYIIYLEVLYKIKSLFRKIVDREAKKLPF
jgi:hypothetical protein